MFFNKKLVHIVLLSVFSFVLLSCSNPEQTDSNDNLNLSLSYDTKCFDGISERWKKWAEGQGSAKNVEKDLDCINEGISYFLRRVKGENTGVYSSQEIYNFTQKFFKDANLSLKLISDLLKMKSWLLGGSDKHFSYVELNTITFFLKSIKTPLSEITPDSEKLFFKDQNNELTLTSASQIKKNINSLFQEFKGLSATNSQALNYKDFEETLKSLQEELNFDGFESKNLKSIWSLLNLVVGKEELSEISLSQSDDLYDGLRDIWFLALKFNYGVIEQGWRNEKSYPHFQQVVNEGFSLFNKILSFQPNKIYEKEKIELIFKNVVLFFDYENELNFDVRKHLIDKVLDLYFKSPNLSSQELAQLQKEWFEFDNFQTQLSIIEGQSFVGSLLENQDFVSLSENNKRAIDFVWPVLSNEDGYVLNSIRPTGITVNYGNLFKINWHRALAKVFLDFFTTDQSRKEKLIGVNITELQQGYEDVFVLLNALDILAADEIGGWFRIFNEANLFVPRALPDEYLSYEEGVDYFALLFSGLEFSGHLIQDINLVCETSNKNCQLNWIKSSPQVYWDSLVPFFGKYLKTISSKEWSELIVGFEEMARGKILDKKFERFELLKISIALQYIEIFFRKYDSNSSEDIDFVETVNSFSKFSAALLALPQIQGTAAESDPQTLLAVYSFFLKNGRLPREVFGQPIELLGWLGKVKRCTKIDSDGQIEVSDKAKSCEYKASRAKLMKILAFLSNAIG